MSSSSQVAESWISAFCSLVGHEYFAEVSEDFIEDDFNLTGLQSQVPMYKEALEMILDVEPEDGTDEDEDDDDASMTGDSEELRASGGAQGFRDQRRHLRMASDLSVIESSAEMLYGLIHQRFITSRTGIQIMAEKYEMGHFGHCPRVFCAGAKVLPVGCSDIPGTDTVKLFCPSCLDVYSPPNSRFQSVDGAFFGTTFGCLFFMTFPELEVAGQKMVEGRESSGSGSTLTNNGSSPLGNGGKGGSRANSAAYGGNGGNTPLASQQQQQLPPQPQSINGIATSNLAPGLGVGNIYEPRIYGFRVSETAKSGPRMKWLRQRPGDVNELDEVTRAEVLSRRTRDAEMEEDVEALDEEEEGFEEEEMEATLDGQGQKKSRRKGVVNGNGDGGGAAIS